VCSIAPATPTFAKSTPLTKVFDPLIEKLKTDRYGWARALRECNDGAEQLCANIQADGDNKIRLYSQAIGTQVADLQQRARLQWPPLSRSGRSGVWLVPLLLLILLLKALPPQPSLFLLSTVRKRPSPPHPPRNLALQRRLLQLWDRSSSLM
jgi:hypothetical protein